MPNKKVLIDEDAAARFLGINVHRLLEFVHENHLKPVKFENSKWYFSLRSLNILYRKNEKYKKFRNIITAIYCLCGAIGCLLLFLSIDSIRIFYVKIGFCFFAGLIGLGIRAYLFRKLKNSPFPEYVSLYIGVLIANAFLIYALAELYSPVGGTTLFYALALPIALFSGIFSNPGEHPIFKWLGKGS